MQKSSIPVADGHFAGTALWALDLTEFVSEDSDGSRLGTIYPTICLIVVSDPGAFF
jgi:hypothetical protein